MQSKVSSNVSALSAMCTPQQNSMPLQVLQAIVEIIERHRYREHILLATESLSQQVVNSAPEKCDSTFLFYVSITFMNWMSNWVEPVNTKNKTKGVKQYWERVCSFHFYGYTSFFPAPDTFSLPAW